MRTFAKQCRTCKMTLCFFALDVMVAIVKTCDANHIDKAENDGRSIRNDGDYRELADEMRTLRDTVRGQGDK